MIAETSLLIFALFGTLQSQLSVEVCRLRCSSNRPLSKLRKLGFVPHLEVYDVLYWNVIRDTEERPEM